MQYTTLGRTGCKVSRLCLGTMNYGPQATEAEGHAQMDKAHELGINFFDTPTSMAGRKAKASPSRSSATGSPKAAGDASERSLRQKSTATWMSIRTITR